MFILFTLIYISEKPEICKKNLLAYAITRPTSSPPPLLRQLPLHSFCISNIKNINGNISPKKVSVVNTELRGRGRGGGGWESNPGGNYVSCFCPMNTAKSLEEQLFYRIPAEVVTSRCSSKYVFLEVLQSSQESICTKVYF